MYASLHARLLTIGEEDNDREDDLGAACPSRLTLLLVGGEHIPDCHLVDGLNSVDDASIDVDVVGEDNPERAAVWIVQIKHIVAMRLRYPLESEIVAARAKASANKAGGAQ